MILVGLIAGQVVPGFVRAGSSAVAWASADRGPQAGTASPAVAVPFVTHGVGSVTTAAVLTARPGSGDVLMPLVPGTKVDVGGAVRVPAGLWSRDIYWLRVPAPAGEVFGFVPADVVSLATGSVPRFDLSRLAPGDLLHPPSASSWPGVGGAEQAGGIAGAQDTGASSAAGPAGGMPAGQGVDIPWLPEAVARWSPLLVEAGARHGVDPEFLAIVVLVESGGNPNAKSASGAVGLMQLMPSTAIGVAAELGLTGFGMDGLWDPATNIELGAKYLATQLAAFGRADDPDWQQSVELAAAAYNGGPGALQQHLVRGVPLTAEAARYRQWVGGQWRERHQPQSATFEAWWAAGGRRLVEAAGEVAAPRFSDSL